MSQTPGNRTPRCSQRKHVIENGQPACDCKALILWPTAARNALVVTLPPGTVLPSAPPSATDNYIARAE